MIVSTRESQKSRERVLHLGISQISGGSRTSVGGYQEPVRPQDTAQFDVSDQRSLDEVVRWLMEMDYIPSFCTACYRAGRTGDRFMSLCKNGEIQNCCHPNALMTLKEYWWTMPPRKPGRSANGSSRGKQETSPASWCMIECSNI